MIMICWISLLLLNGFFVIAVKTDTRAKTAIECYNDMYKENNILHLLLDVKSSQEIAAFCKRMNGWMVCISDNEDHLSTAENTAHLRRTAGIHQFWLIVCKSETRFSESYKAHAPCFELVRNQMLSCSADIPDEQSPDMRASRTKCCILQEYNECMSSAVTKRCGNEAGNLTTLIVKGYFVNSLKECENIGQLPCQTSKGVRETDNDGYLTSSTRRYYTSNPWTRKDDEKKKWEEEEEKWKPEKDWKHGKCEACHQGPYVIFFYVAVSIILNKVWQ